MDPVIYEHAESLSDPSYTKPELMVEMLKVMSHLGSCMIHLAENFRKRRNREKILMGVKLGDLRGGLKPKLGSCVLVFLKSRVQ